MTTRARLAEGLRGRADAGAVDEDVDPAAVLGPRVERGSDVVGARDVGGGEGSRGAERLGDVGSGGGRAVEQGDAGTGGDEPGRGGAAEPRSAAGNDGFDGRQFHYRLASPTATALTTMDPSP